MRMFSILLKTFRHNSSITNIRSIVVIPSKPFVYFCLFSQNYRLYSSHLSSQSSHTSQADSNDLIANTIKLPLSLRQHIFTAFRTAIFSAAKSYSNFASKNQDNWGAALQVGTDSDVILNDMISRFQSLIFQHITCDNDQTRHCKNEHPNKYNLPLKMKNPSTVNIFLDSAMIMHNSADLVISDASSVVTDIKQCVSKLTLNNGKTIENPFLLYRRLNALYSIQQLNHFYCVSDFHFPWPSIWRCIINIASNNPDQLEHCFTVLDILQKMKIHQSIVTQNRLGHGYGVEPEIIPGESDYGNVLVTCLGVSLSSDTQGPLVLQRLFRMLLEDENLELSRRSSPRAHPLKDDMMRLYKRAIRRCLAKLFLLKRQDLLLEWLRILRTYKSLPPVGIKQYNSIMQKLNNLGFCENSIDLFHMLSNEYGLDPERRPQPDEESYFNCLVAYSNLIPKKRDSTMLTKSRLVLNEALANFPHSGLVLMAQLKHTWSLTQDPVKVFKHLRDSVSNLRLSQRSFCEAYRFSMKKYLESAQYDEILQVFEHMEKNAGLFFENFVPTPNILVILSKLAERNADGVKMLRMYQFLYSLDGSNYLEGHLVKHRDMLQKSCTDSVYASTLISLVNSRDKVKYFQLLQEVKDAVQTPTITLWNSIFETLVKLGEKETLWKYYERFQNRQLVGLGNSKYRHIFFSNTTTYRILIRACESDSDCNRIARFISEAELCSSDVDLMQVYKTAINVYSKNRNLEDAINIFQKVKSLGEPIKRDIYSSIISVYSRKNNIDGALLTLKEWEKQNKFLNIEQHPDYLVSIKEYNCVIRFHANRGNYAKCVELFQHLETRNVKANVYTFNCLLESARRSGFPSRIKEEMNRLMDYFLRDDEHATLSSHTRLKLQYAFSLAVIESWRNSDLGYIKKLVSVMRNHEIEPTNDAIGIVDKFKFE